MTKLSSNPPSLANAFLTLVQGDETLQIIGWLGQKLDIVESTSLTVSWELSQHSRIILDTKKHTSSTQSAPPRSNDIQDQSPDLGTNPTWFSIYPDTTNVTTDTTIISDNSFEQQFYNFRQQWTRTTNNNHHSNKKKKNSNNRNNNKKKKKKKKKKKQQQQEQQPKKSSHFKLLLCWFSISPPGPSCAKRMSPSTTVGGSLSWRNIRDYPKS